MKPDELSDQPAPTPAATTRRQFLQQTAGAVATAAVLAELASPVRLAGAQGNSQGMLPTVKLGSHEVTRPFGSIKPTDGVIVGMYQQSSDQVGENAGIVRDIGAGRPSH